MKSVLQSRMFILLMFILLTNIVSSTLDGILKKFTNQAADEETEKLPHTKYFIVIENNDDGISIKENKEFEAGYQDSKYLILVNKDSFKPVQRRFRDLKRYREESRNAKLVKTQHDRKVKEINEFMEEHYLTTNYLYDEVQRIKKQRIVKDDLRRMVEYLDQPGKSKVKSEVFKCYYKVRDQENIGYDRWAQDTNNLVINVLKDPYNDGYIN